MSDDEWEEEEQCLMVDLHGILETDFLQNAEGNCKVLGIGTETPYLQLDGYTFAGKYVPPLGSYLVLEEKTAENASTNASLEFVACLDRKLDMNRAFISPKVPEGSVTAEESSSNAGTSQQDPTDTQDKQNQNSADEPTNQHAEPVSAELETVSKVT